jgi:hypothetical protein
VHYPSHSLAASFRPMSGAASNFIAAAEELRESEYSRLAGTVAPTVEKLRSLTSAQFRARVVTMLEHFGHELATTENAAVLVMTKGGHKFVVSLAAPTNLAPTALRDLTRLHSAVIAASATSGFFITARGFTPEAEAYAATAPLKLVDGEKLVASINRGMDSTTMPNGYRVMCRQCGDIVKHTLDRAEAVPCRNGHPVAPTIARATLVPVQAEGAATTYTPPRQFSRYEVRAHNAKYQAKRRRLKPRPAAH